MEFGGEQLRDFRCHLERCSRVQEECSSPACEHVFCGSCLLVPCSPDDFPPLVREQSMQWTVECGILPTECSEFMEVRPVDSFPLGSGCGLQFLPAVQVQVRGTRWRGGQACSLDSEGNCVFPHLPISRPLPSCDGDEATGGTDDVVVARELGSGRVAAAHKRP